MCDEKAFNLEPLSVGEKNLRVLLDSEWLSVKGSSISVFSVKQDAPDFFIWMGLIFAVSVWLLSDWSFSEYTLAFILLTPFLTCHLGAIFFPTIRTSITLDNRVEIVTYSPYYPEKLSFAELIRRYRGKSTAPKRDIARELEEILEKLQTSDAVSSPK